MSNVTDENGSSLGILGATTVQWHSDMASFQEPPSASILYALEVPARAGDTHFSNMYVAYDTLPKKLKRELLSYAIHHRVVPGSSGPGTGARHPVVCTHPDTGHNALFLGARQHTAVTGLPKHESDRLLDFLWAHATLPEFCYRHRWRPGDVLIWDNRCTVHYRDPFDPRDRRVLLRVQVEGSATPRLAPNALELSPHPRGFFSEK